MQAYFLFSGLENGQVPISGKITLWEIIKNEGKYKDTELLYSLREEEDLLELWQIEKVQINRDNDKSVAVLHRVGKSVYESFNDEEENE